jgi:Ni,Fe-hydrogenase III large subunit
MLSEQEKEQILSELPNIKLSYENIIHKKVYSNFVLAIPEGKKCFAWFTNSKNGNVCYILELKENKQVYDIKIVNCCFNNCLSYGTIFYGTVFNNLGNTFFSIEDIFFYKGVNVSTYIWMKKLELFNVIS